MQMTLTDLAEVKMMIETFGVEQVLEHVAMACDDIAEECDEGNHDESARQWRVRGNGVKQGLRLYLEFVKERNA
jgi:hypothetical protein